MCQINNKSDATQASEKGQVYNFGDPINVKITKIDLLKREVDFVII